MYAQEHVRIYQLNNQIRIASKAHYIMQIMSNHEESVVHWLATSDFVFHQRGLTWPMVESAIASQEDFDVPLFIQAIAFCDAIVCVHHARERLQFQGIMGPSHYYYTTQ